MILSSRLVGLACLLITVKILRAWVLNLASSRIPLPSSVSALAIKRTESWSSLKFFGSQSFAVGSVLWNFVSLYSLLSSFLVRLRSEGYIFLLFGDLNGCTAEECGWTGDNALFCSSAFSPGYRDSDCQKEECDAEGSEMIKLCVASESRIINGLRLESSSLRSSKRITRPDTAIDDSDIADISDTPVPGSVLDYFIASEELIPALSELVVLPIIPRFSDHCPISLSWAMNCKNNDAAVADNVVQSSPFVGWSIRGIPSKKFDYERFMKAAARYMSEHPDRPRVRSLIDKGNPSIAHRFLHGIIRDGLEHAGASVRLSDGSSGASFRIPALPVKSWFDDEAREAHRA